MVFHIKNSFKVALFAVVAGLIFGLSGTAPSAQSLTQDAEQTTPQQLRLLMIEQIGCAVCAQFNREIAPIYEVSREGEIAPILRADLRGPLPDGVTLNSRPFVTPTFILIDADGQELSRLTGFPGEDFFWPYLNEMIDNAMMP